MVLLATLPDYASDLLLDQIVAQIIKGADEYDLLPYFATRLTDVRDVIYRQDVFSDVTDHSLTQAFVDYGEAMHLARTWRKRRNSTTSCSARLGAGRRGGPCGGGRWPVHHVAGRTTALRCTAGPAG